jgi:hypothetical protein
MQPVTAICLCMLLASCATIHDPLAELRAIDCISGRFTTQGEAQAFYELHPEHWWTLDPLRKGVACPDLPRQAG